MLNLRLGLNRSCDRVTRRDVLRVGSLAALGLSSAGLLGAHGTGLGGPVRHEVSCILLWLQGGISHIDSFDPKPEAPEEIRGEFGAIATNVPGIMLCDPLPRLAQHQDKYSILRSLNPRNGSHGVADAYMMSGHPFNQALTYPAYGAVVAKEQGDRKAMPPYVQLGTSIDQRFGGGVAGFLGDQYNPFVLPGDASSPSFAVRDVVLPGGVDREPVPAPDEGSPCGRHLAKADGERAGLGSAPRRPARSIRRPITWSRPPTPRRRSTSTRKIRGSATATGGTRWARAACSRAG